jgi:hypothetical protein
MGNILVMFLETVSTFIFIFMSWIKMNEDFGSMRVVYLYWMENPNYLDEKSSMYGRIPL